MTTHIAVVEVEKCSHTPVGSRKKAMWDRTPVGIPCRKQAIGELNNPCWAEVRGLVDAEKFALVRLKTPTLLPDRSPRLIVL
jgi:hypothetical protein